MARYKIYDNKSDVITPVGEKLTAEQWLDRYQWGRYTKMIVGGGIIYTLGMIPFVKDTKGAHFIWHIFVMLGAALHWFGMYIFVY